MSPPPRQRPRTERERPHAERERPRSERERLHTEREGPHAERERPPSALVRSIARAVLLVLPIAIALVWSSEQTSRGGELGFPMDDPYIHFQFAKNLATGHGFSFNPGEPTPGATSPLWVVLLAAGRAVGIPLEPWALALGVLMAGAVALLTLEVAIAAGLPFALALGAGVATALCGRLVWASLTGMEITLATALFLALVRAQQSQLAGLRRGLALGALCGLASNARPEMVMLGPLVLAVEVWRARATPRAALVIGGGFLATFALVLAPYAAFCFATTGRWLPNTYYAKGVIARASDPNLAHYRATYAPLMYQIATHDNLAFALLLIPGFVLWAFARERRPALLVALWPLAFWIYSFVVFPRHFSLSRYTMPLVPCFALLSIVSVAWLAARLRGRAALALTVAAWIAIAVGAWRSVAEYRPLYLEHVDNILHQQVRAGRWVASNLPRGARIAANDVGAITYYGNRYCIDTVGLVSADAITHFLKWRKQHGSIFVEEALPSFLRMARPDFCILFPLWYPNLTQAPWLRAVGEFDYPNSTGGGDRLVVYRVVGTPVGPLDGPVSPR